MTDIPKYCPMRFDPTGTLHKACIQGKCAWYDRLTAQCAFVSIAWSLWKEKD